MRNTKTSVTVRERVRANSITLYLDIYHKGERRQEALGLQLSKRRDPENARKREEAEKRRVEREVHLLLGSGLLRPEQVSFIQFMEGEERWKSVTRYLNACCPNISLADLSAETIATFEQHGFECGLSQNTVCTYTRAIKAAAHLAMRKGLITKDPFVDANVTGPIEVVREHLSMEELQTLARAEVTISVGHRHKYTDRQRQDIKWAYLFACYQGFRLSDVSELRDTDIADGMVRKIQQKTNRIVILPLHPVAQKIVEGRKGKLFDLPPLKLCTYYIKKTARECGITKNVGFHTSRHTAAMQMLSSTNGNIMAVKEHLGHTNVRTTMIYARMLPDDMRKAVESMPWIDI